MKTQSIGWSHYETPPALLDSIREATTNGGARLVARENYIEKRLNGEDADSPLFEIPLNGIYSDWLKAPLPGDARFWYRIRYTESAEDREWMQLRDRNYLSRLARTARWEDFDRMKGAAWPDHLTEFAEQLEADHRIKPAQREVREKAAHEARQDAEPLFSERNTSSRKEKLICQGAGVSSARAYEHMLHRLDHSQQQRHAELISSTSVDVELEHQAERETKAHAEEETRAVVAFAVTAQAEDRHQEVLRLLDTYLHEHPRSTEALKLRAYSRAQLASRARFDDHRISLLKAARSDFDAVLDIDMIDHEADEGLKRMNR